MRIQDKSLDLTCISRSKDFSLGLLFWDENG